jgi:DNA (cytosine-5)-methyltransferase 1
MYEIVGNGVASRVAWYLGKALAEQLQAAEKKRAIQSIFPLSYKVKSKPLKEEIK